MYGDFTDAHLTLQQGMRNIRRLGGTRRFWELDRLERYYGGTQHDGKPSWWEEGVPARERRPCVLSGLPKAAVEQAVRFTLGEGKFPALRFTGSEEQRTIAGINLGLTKDEAKTLDQLWKEIADQIKVKLGFRELLRRGLSMRSACGVYSLRDGELWIEYLNVKHCEVEWKDARKKVPARLECRFIYPREEEQKDGTIKEVWYWYRRVVDEQADTVYQPVEVKEGSEPKWTVDDSKSFEHHSGFAPVFWFQNLPRMDVADDDGVALIDGCEEEIDAIDYALSVRHTGAFVYGNPQAYQIGVFEDKAPQADGRTAGTIDYFNTVNPDGSPGTPMAFAAINPTGGGLPARKRSAFTVWSFEDKKTDVEIGLLEATGTAAKMVTEHVTDLRARLLESIQVVLVDPASVAGRSDMSAKLLELLYAPLLALVDDLRECWGDHLRSLAGGLLRFLRVQFKRTPGRIFLPGLDEAAPILDRFAVASQGGGEQWINPPCSLAWGTYFAPTNADIRDAVVTAKSARGEATAGGAGSGGDTTSGPLISHKTAVTYIAPFFGLDDIDAELEEVTKEQEDRDAKAEQQAQRELDAALTQIVAKAGADGAAKPPGSGPPAKGSDSGRPKSG